MRCVRVNLEGGWAEVDRQIALVHDAPVVAVGGIPVVVGAVSSLKYRLFLAGTVVLRPGGPAVTRLEAWWTK